MLGDRRLTVLPIVHHDLWALYKQAQNCYWTAEELDLTKDPNGFAALNPKQQHFLKHVLAFFAASDGLVNANLMERFLAEVTAPEASCFYGFQIAMEGVHGEVYSRLIETLFPAELDALLAAVNTFPAIKAKADWVRGWSTGDASLVQRLVAFACVEGILFSGSFAAIFWLKSKGVAMPGLYASNQFISRDEGLHTNFAVALVNKLLPDHPEDEATLAAIVRGAVELEKAFLIDALPVADLGMNSNLMATYIEFVADRLMADLNLPPAFGAENPFPFMETISMEGKTNFFEARPTEYQSNAIRPGELAFDAEF